jgi:hypothetical protein
MTAIRGVAHSDETASENSRWATNPKAGLHCAIASQVKRGIAYNVSRALYVN